MSTNYQLENIETKIRQENERHQRAKQTLERQKQRENEQHSNTMKRLKDEKDRITKTHGPQTDEDFQPEFGILEKLKRAIKEATGEDC